MKGMSMRTLSPARALSAAATACRTGLFRGGAFGVRLRAADGPALAFRARVEVAPGPVLATVFVVIMTSVPHR
jgi:hypothetical protein